MPASDAIRSAHAPAAFTRIGAVNFAPASLVTVHCSPDRLIWGDPRVGMELAAIASQLGADCPATRHARRGGLHCGRPGRGPHPLSAAGTARERPPHRADRGRRTDGISNSRVSSASRSSSRAWIRTGMAVSKRNVREFIQADFDQASGWQVSVHAASGHRGNDRASARFDPTSEIRSALPPRAPLPGHGAGKSGRRGEAGDTTSDHQDVGTAPLIRRRWSRSFTTLPACVRQMRLHDLIVIGKLRLARLLDPERT